MIRLFHENNFTYQIYKIRWMIAQMVRIINSVYLGVSVKENKKIDKSQVRLLK